MISLKKISEIIGVSLKTVYDRLKFRSWTLEEMLKIKEYYGLKTFNDVIELIEFLEKKTRKNNTKKYY